MFNLTGKKNLKRNQNEEIETVVVDVSEHELERKKYYIGKQKYHTIKPQVLGNQKNAKIICTAFSAGKTHNFVLEKKVKSG